MSVVAVSAQLQRNGLSLAFDRPRPFVRPSLAAVRRESDDVVRGIPGVIALLPQNPSFVSLPFSICFAPGWPCLGRTARVRVV